MRFRVSKNTNKMVMDKLINWDFSDEAEKQIASADKTHKELYANLKNFIKDFTMDFDKIKLISDQLTGFIEVMMESSENLQIATEFISEGAQNQANDINTCRQIADMLSN